MGTYPSAISSLKVPIVQCSSKYITGSTANDESKGRDSIVEKAKGFTLASFITTKKNESSYLTTQCSPAVAGERIIAQVDAAWQEFVTILGSQPDKNSVQYKQYSELRSGMTFLVNQANTIAYND